MDMGLQISILSRDGKVVDELVLKTTSLTLSIAVQFQA